MKMMSNVLSIVSFVPVYVFYDCVLMCDKVNVDCIINAVMIWHSFVMFFFVTMVWIWAGYRRQTTNLGRTKKANL